MRDGSPWRVSRPIVRVGPLPICEELVFVCTGEYSRRRTRALATGRRHCERMSRLAQNQQISPISTPACERTPAGPGADISEKLDRVLQAVEKQQRPGALELALVIVLALTALGSTWCAYQSQLWNGVQLVRLSDADDATQDANESTLAGMQRRSLHATILLHFVEAMYRGDSTLADAIHRRMESPLPEAVDAWQALDPLNNPDVPQVAKMPQYTLPEFQQAEKERARASGLRAEAQRAGNNGDTYVLLTLMFASVLFFGGITGTFRSRRLRIGLASIACVLFLVTVGSLTGMPVCKG